MDKFSDQKSAVQYLHPPIEPFDRRMMDVGDGHEIYVEQSGQPTGLPVVVLHGGPGGGCSPAMRRYFDPKIYRIIPFDQRGCGRSRPHASVEANTTWHLVRDIEQIRDTLSIDRWIVFGGSWGATLALIYGQTHPDRALHLVLRGVFTMTEGELDWFYGGGAGAFWPETWVRFVALIPRRNATISSPPITSGSFPAIWRRRSPMPRRGLLGKTRLPRCNPPVSAATARRITPAPSPGLKTTISRIAAFLRKTGISLPAWTGCAMCPAPSCRAAMT